MVYLDGTNESIDRIVQQYCAPLFGNTHLLHGGHDSSTTNATVTFVQFEGRFYAVTCHHVLSAFFTEANKKASRLCPSVHAGKAIVQFGSYDQDGSFKWAFTSCREFPDPQIMDDMEALDAFDRANWSRPDIAIADLTETWPTFQPARGAKAINLDAWVKPDWATMQKVWMAYGFPNDHKSRSGEIVSAPMPRVAAELASDPPTEGRDTYTLCSVLEKEHGWGFSGLSGGPVIAPDTEADRYAFVGITFEGAPSSATDEMKAEAFITKQDILLKGYHLTPGTFKQWLAERRFGVRFPP